MNSFKQILKLLLFKDLVFMLKFWTKFVLDNSRKNCFTRIQHHKPGDDGYDGWLWWWRRWGETRELWGWGLKKSSFFGWIESETDQCCSGINFRYNHSLSGYSLGELKYKNNYNIFFQYFKFIFLFFYLLVFLFLSRVTTTSESKRG